MKRIAYFLLFNFISITSASVIAQDNTVLVTANIVDAATKEPIKTTIYYQSLPYGSKVGIFNNVDTFEFKMEKGDTYQLTLKSEGYLPFNVTLSSHQADSTQTIKRSFEMTSNGIGKIIMLETLTFEQGKSKISFVAHEELDRLAENMIENPTIIIQLEGHTDFKGNKQLNYNLSEDRVKATKEYLVKKGISKKRIFVKGFGGDHPLSRSNDPKARLKNRRVEVRIIEN